MGKDQGENREADAARPAKSWTAEEKLRLVLEAAKLSEQELGAFLRREGVHAAQLEQWRQVVTSAATEALQPNRKAASARPSPTESRRIRELERELRRKDKALAEVTALLALKKKLEMLWGDADDDTDPENDE